MSSWKVWHVQWKNGCWETMTRPFTHPSFSVPKVLEDRYVMRSITSMPAGPYVQDYGFIATEDEKKDVLGYPGMTAKVDVRWQPFIHEAIERRQALFGGRAAQEEADRYHSRIALSGNWLLLNAASKINSRAKMNYEEMAQVHDKVDKRWDDLILWVHEFIREHSKWNADEALAYRNSHQTSTLIPRTGIWNSLHWREASLDDLHYINEELTQPYLDWLLGDWETNRLRIWNPGDVGRGVRSKGPEVEGIKDQYIFKFNEARPIKFDPVRSPWWQTVGHENEAALYRHVKEKAEEILGVEILFPILEQGGFWLKIANILDEQGIEVRNDDGSTWDTWASVITKCYHLATDEGNPQLASGIAMTSVIGTIANLMFLEYQLGKATSQLRAISALGDDRGTFGKPDLLAKIREKEGVWKNDEIGTRRRTFLGIMLLPKGLATFAGIYRVTEDRGDKVQGRKLNTYYPKIDSSITPDSLINYRTIMEYGKIGDEPMLYRMAHVSKGDFFERWIRDKTDALSADVQSIAILPEEYAEPLIDDVPKEYSEEGELNADYETETQRRGILSSRY